MLREQIHLTVNGQIISLGAQEALAPLSDTLRYLMRKTGTKVVCAEGDCGACTVMMTRVNESQDAEAAPSQSRKYRSINSCIVPTFLMDGCHVITVEALAQDQQLHEVQSSMVRNFGAQCGFCTPGFVMSITNMFEHKAKPSTQNIKNYLTGNLCRCTGYQSIIDAAKDVDTQKLAPLAQRFAFPEQSKELTELTSNSILIKTEEVEFFAPKTLAEAIDYKSKYPDCRIFSGATDIGVQINKGKHAGRKQMSLHLIHELYEIQTFPKVRIGARVTLDRLQTFAEKHLPIFGQFMHIFASPQIKNSATLVGNLANGSPIGDTIPFLMTLDADVLLVGPQGQRHVPVKDFFKAYKTFDMLPSELIQAVEFDLPDMKKTKIGLYKVSQRRDLDISSINASFWIEEKNGVVKNLKLALGGVGPTPLRLSKVESQLVNKKIDRNFVDETKKLLAQSIQPLSDLRGSHDFRKLMAQQVFEKFAQEHLNL